MEQRFIILAANLQLRRDSLIPIDNPPRRIKPSFVPCKLVRLAQTPNKGWHDSKTTQRQEKNQCLSTLVQSKPFTPSRSGRPRVRPNNHTYYFDPCQVFRPPPLLSTFELFQCYHHPGRWRCSTF